MLDRDLWQRMYLEEHKRVVFLVNLLEQLYDAQGDPVHPRNAGNSAAYHNTASILSRYGNARAGDVEWWEVDYRLTDEDLESK